MHFRIAYPRRLFAEDPVGGADVVAFYDLLFDCLRERGHSFETFADLPQPPPRRPGEVSLGYHSTGRAPAPWHIKRSYLAGTFYFDRDGYSGWSQMARDRALFEASREEDEAEALAFVAQMRAHSLRHGVSRWRQPPARYDGDGQRYVVLPLQVATDTVMQLSRIDFFDFARGVARALAGSDYRLVIKRHPACNRERVFRLMVELGALPHVRVTNTAIGSLLADAAGVVCINSGVGFEALFHDCPVVTAGGSDYEWMTMPLADLDGLEALPRLLEQKPDLARRAGFLSFFCRRLLIRQDDREAMMSRLAVVETEALATDQGGAGGDLMHALAPEARPT